MRTCKYCGTTLDFVGSYKDKVYFSCDFCDLTFDIEQTSENRKRKKSIPKSFDNYRRTTKELLQLNTIELFHILKAVRSDWYESLQMVQRIKRLYEQNGTDPEKDETYLALYEEYVDLTKYKFVIENVLIEKAGYLPEKITEEFLDDLMEKASKSPQTPMNIFVK